MVVLNRIYTRTGDDGTTALGSGERRPKYDLRVSAYGTVDETNAAIGVARLHLSGYLLFARPSRALAEVALAAARARGVPVSMDPASTGFLVGLGTDRFLAFAAGLDVLLPSRDEACLLTGLPDGAAAAAELSRRVPLVVAKLGAEGALVARSGEVCARVPAPPVAARDTTGAGDAFTSGLLDRLLLAGVTAPDRLADAVTDDQLIDTVLDHGLAVAAITCGRPGADPPTAAELDAVGYAR